MARHVTLAEACPDLASELADHTLANQLTTGSHARVEWVCTHDPRHRWEAEVASRVRGAGCPFCAGQRAFPGVDDLATLRPDVAGLLADPRDASGVTVGSGRVLRWRCPDCGRVWTAPVKNVVRSRDAGRTGCPACAGRTGRTRRGLVADERHDLVAEAVDPHDLDGVTSGSGKVVRWRCTRHGRPVTYEMSVRNRVRGEGCPVCAGTMVVPGVNDLATVRPDLAAEMVDQDLARHVGKGSMAVVSWHCPHGHTWNAPVYSRVAGNGCPVCATHTFSSTGERELADAVRALVGPGVEVLTNDRSLLSGRELDVVVPSRHVAVEYEGLWYHSEAMQRDTASHLDKVRACARLGYRLVLVWEDDWRRRRDVVVAMLAHKLHALDRLAIACPGIDPKACGRVYARSLDVRRVGGHDAAAFLEANHVQGAVTATLHLALVDQDGDIRALLSARSPRAQSRTRRADGTWELVRFATCGEVPGAASRLLAHATGLLRSQGLTRWVSFSANDVSDGGLYERLGFKRDGDVRPDYRYFGHVTGDVRRPKESFQLRRFRDDPALAYEDGWTEVRAARENGLVRVWDAGKVRWVLDVA